MIKIIGSITVVVLALLVYLGLTLLPKPLGKIFSLLYLGIFFLFTTIHISPEQGIFYGLLIIFTFILDIIGFGLVEIDKAKILGITFKGIAFVLFSVVIGILIYFFMEFLGGTTPKAIIGVPQALQISTTAATALSSAGIGLLGIAENRFFISLIKSLFVLFPFIPIAAIPILGLAAPILNIILPFLIGAFLFAIFHGTILIGGVGFLIYAFFIFLIWAMIAFTPLGETAGEVSHFTWNVVKTLEKVLGAIG